MAIIADITGAGGGPAGVIVSEVIFGGPLNNLKEAQTFQVIEGMWDVTSVSLRLDRNFTAAGSAETGNLTLSIKEDSPVGAVLGTSAVERTDISLTEAWKSFTFSGVELSSGNTYCLVLECPYGFDDKPVGVGGLGDDLIQWFIDPGVGPYASGERHYYRDETGWVESATQDNRAIVYGDDISLPGQATDPTPDIDASDITLHSTTGTWVSGGNTDSYNVYYGTLSGFLSLVDNTVDLSIALVEGQFSIYGKISYWRVDAVNAFGITPGVEWVFTTMLFGPPLPTGVTLDAEGEPTGTPTGESGMLTVRRLVAAANNKFWYENI